MNCALDVPVLPSQALIEQVGRENIERAYNTYNYSQEMVADGSFVRLKNVALAYRLSESVAKKLLFLFSNRTLECHQSFADLCRPSFARSRS